MNSNIVKKNYARMKKYSFIHDLAVDSVKVANTAYEEYMISYLEIVYKFNGLIELSEMVKLDEDDSFKLKTSMLLSTVDLDHASKIIKTLVESSDLKVRLSAINLKNGIDKATVKSYNDILQKLKIKKRL